MPHEVDRNIRGDGVGFRRPERRSLESKGLALSNDRPSNHQDTQSSEGSIQFAFNGNNVMVVFDSRLVGASQMEKAMCAAYTDKFGGEGEGVVKIASRLKMNIKTYYNRRKEPLPFSVEIRSGFESTAHPVSEEEIERLLMDKSEVERIPFGDTGKELIFASESGKEIIKKIRIYAQNNEPVLIHGPTGAGKEPVAMALHYLSGRKDQPFIALNCAALPKDLAESELFGHIAGSFTGAARTHKGAFEQVGQGTLFLDEFTAMPKELQSKLLRILEDRRIIPVGSGELKKPLPSEARVILATNSEDLGNEDVLRKDMRCRVTRGGYIRIPSLSDRRKDILPLAIFFLTNYGNEASQFILSRDASKELLRYDYPLNVRELSDILFRTSEEARCNNRHNGQKKVVEFTGEQIRRNIIDFKQKHG